MHPFDWPFILSFPSVNCVPFLLLFGKFWNSDISVYLVMVSIFLYNIILVHNKETWVEREHKGSYF